MTGSSAAFDLECPAMDTRGRKDRPSSPGAFELRERETKRKREREASRIFY